MGADSFYQVKVFGCSVDTILEKLKTCPQIKVQGKNSVLNEEIFRKLLEGFVDKHSLYQYRETFILLTLEIPGLLIEWSEQTEYNPPYIVHFFKGQDREYDADEFVNFLLGKLNSTFESQLTEFFETNSSESN